MTWSPALASAIEDECVALDHKVFLLVDDLDGGRQFVGIDPDDDLVHDAGSYLEPVGDGEVVSAISSWAVPS
jgi:hypothetical protein